MTSTTDHYVQLAAALDAAETRDAALFAALCAQRCVSIAEGLNYDSSDRALEVVLPALSIAFDVLGDPASAERSKLESLAAACDRLREEGIDDPAPAPPPAVSGLDVVRALLGVTDSASDVVPAPAADSFTRAWEIVVDHTAEAVSCCLESLSRQDSTRAVMAARRLPEMLDELFEMGMDSLREEVSRELARQRHDLAAIRAGTYRGDVEGSGIESLRATARADGFRISRLLQAELE